jgi:hypothetical protein
MSLAAFNADSTETFSVIFSTAQLIVVWLNKTNLKCIPILTKILPGKRELF